MADIEYLDIYIYRYRYRYVSNIMADIEYLDIDISQILWLISQADLQQAARFLGICFRELFFGFFLFRINFGIFFLGPRKTLCPIYGSGCHCVREFLQT